MSGVAFPRPGGKTVALEIARKGEHDRNVYAHGTGGTVAAPAAEHRAKLSPDGLKLRLFLPGKGGRVEIGRRVFRKLRCLRGF